MTGLDLLIGLEVCLLQTQAYTEKFTAHAISVTYFLKEGKGNLSVIVTTAFIFVMSDKYCYNTWISFLAGAFDLNPVWVSQVRCS